MGHFQIENLAIMINLIIVQMEVSGFHQQILSLFLLFDNNQIMRGHMVAPLHSKEHCQNKSTFRRSNYLFFQGAKSANMLIFKDFCNAEKANKNEHNVDLL